MERQLIPDHIVTYVSEILEQIAMNSAPKPADPDRKTAAKERLQQERALRERQGKDALSNLKAAKRIGEQDAQVIARNLHPEVESLKALLKQKGDGLGEFCKRAGLASDGEYSKALYRLTLGPEQDPLVTRPYRTAYKYLQLIEAISAVKNESVSILADRIVIGSSLHPKNIAEWNETQKIHAILQRVVDDIDQQFGLYAKFMEVADLKAAHVVSGGTTSWPFDALNTIDEGESAPNAKKASDPRSAYWWNDIHSPEEDYDEDKWLNVGQEHMIIDEEIFYLPHAFIGKLDPDDMFGHDQGDLMGWTPLDGWDDINKRPVAQPMPSDNREDYIMCDDWWCFVTWLMVYPSPTENQLIPILFTPSWGGAIVEILDVRTLDSLRERQWIGKGRATTTAFKQIQELLGLVADSKNLGENKIRSSLVRTAPWFDFNPIFKLQRDKQAHEKRLEQLFNREMNL